MDTLKFKYPTDSGYLESIKLSDYLQVFFLLPEDIV